MRGLSAPTPRIWYASLFAKPRCRYQPSRANSKISYKVGNWHASPPLRRETAATGPSFLAAATTSGWPDYRLQDIQGPYGYWSELVFHPPARRGLRGHPFKILQGASHRRRRGSAFSVRVVKYWNKLSTSVVTATSVNVFKKKSFPISSIDWTLTTPLLACTPPINTRCLQIDFKVHFTARTWDLVCSMQNFMLYLMV